MDWSDKHWTTLRKVFKIRKFIYFKTVQKNILRLFSVNIKMGAINKAKYKQILHYILDKCGSQFNVGKTVIWKILYFSDFDFYEEKEIPLLGERYFKLTHGPAPSHFDEIIKELKEDKLIRELHIKSGKYTWIKFLSLHSPQINLLNSEELRILNRTIQKLCTMSAQQISSYSHQDMPWKATEDKKEIDYELVFYRDDTMSVREYPNDAV